jgi:hypothetical protein
VKRKQVRSGTVELTCRSCSISSTLSAWRGICRYWKYEDPVIIENLDSMTCRPILTCAATHFSAAAYLVTTFHVRYDSISISISGVVSAGKWMSNADNTHRVCPDINVHTLALSLSQYKVSGAFPPRSQYSFMAWCVGIGKTLHSPFIINEDLGVDERMILKWTLGK